MVEHFRDSCGGVISWLDSSTYYTAFTEGWALYAENPLIAQETNVYDKAPFQKYGMLKWQVWIRQSFVLWAQENSRFTLLISCSFSVFNFFPPVIVLQGVAKIMIMIIIIIMITMMKLTIMIMIMKMIKVHYN